MRTFELFLDIMGDWISISNSQIPVQAFSPYDEKLDEQDHSQYNLTFSIIAKQYIDDKIEWNPLLSYYFMGARLLLKLDNKQTINLIISKIAPDESQTNTIYNITAQDEVSYLWSKHNVGYNYSTLDRENTNALLSPRDIFTIANDVLEDNFLSDWTVTSQSLDPALKGEKITLEITNSNPYNVIIEACNTLNASLVVNYRIKRLDFYRKDLRPFSGYRYRPDYNIINYNTDYSGEQLATLLHVHGGTDANDVQISMIPSMPEPLRRYFYYGDRLLQGTPGGTIEGPTSFAEGKDDIQWSTLLNNKFDWTAIQNKIMPDAHIPCNRREVTGVAETQKKTVSKVIPDPMSVENINLQLQILSQNIDISNGGEYDYWHITQVYDYVEKQELWVCFALGRQTELLCKIPYNILVNEYVSDNNKYTRIYDKINILYSSSVEYVNLPVYTARQPDIAIENYTIVSISLPYIFKTINIITDTKTTIIEDSSTLKYYAEPTAAFLPITGYTYDDITVEDYNTYTYYIKFNNIRNKYEGIIKYMGTDDPDSAYTLTFDITPDNWDVSVNPNAPDEMMKEVYLINTDSQPQSIYIYYSINAINELRAKSQKQQTEELSQFFAVAKQVPYLGQFLIDLQTFRPYISVGAWNNLQNLINITFRNLNIQLQYYTTEYYSAVYDLMQLRAKIIAYGQIYNAACMNYEQLFNKEGESVNLIDAKNEIIKAKTNLMLLIQNSSYGDILKQLGTCDDTELDISTYTSYFENEKLKYQKQVQHYYDELILLLNGSDDGLSYNAEIESKKTYLQNLIHTTQSLYEDFNFTLDGQSVLSMYDIIIQIINETYSENITNSGLANKYYSLQNQIHNSVISVLYSQYGQFIYEQAYENTDELDSVSLFNQAYAHFVNIKRIQSNHTLESLDIGELECINIPRLSIGSIIEVQNKNSIQSQSYAFLLSQIEKEEALCKYYLSTNNIIEYNNSKLKLDQYDTGLRYQLLKLYNLQHEAQVNSYEELLNILYADQIQVTGISRVLREPLKDSVTVQQISMYKNILSKLIKSI